MISGGIVDMHCDTISELLMKKRKGKQEGLYSNTGHLDIARMKKQGYLLQNMALFVNLLKCADPWEEFLALVECYKKEMGKNRELIAPVYTYNDIEKNRSRGKLSAMLTAEEGQICKGDAEKLRTMYDLGVRMMTITWNYPNCLGYPAKDASASNAVNQGGGLTDTGKEIVCEMERLGIIIDVSHLSDQGFQDVLQLTKKPFVASHSNARALCGHPRNMTDEMIRALADRGGCMGLNFYQDFLQTGEAQNEAVQGGLADLVRHAKHIVNVGGVEILGLGSDFDGIDTNADIPDVTAMEQVWNSLHKSGFSEENLDKIFCKNVLRVYRDVL